MKNILSKFLEKCDEDFEHDMDYYNRCAKALLGRFEIKEKEPFWTCRDHGECRLKRNGGPHSLLECDLCDKEPIYVQEVI